MFRTSQLNIIIGIYLFISALVGGVYYALSYSSGVEELFWYCNVAMIVAGLGFCLKKNILISAVFVCAIPSQIYWILGDLLHLAGLQTVGRYEWLREDVYGLGLIFDINYHFAIIPLTLFGVMRYGYHRKADRMALVIFIPLLIFSRLFGNPAYNVNCMHYPCDVIFRPGIETFYGWSYTLWRLVYFIAISYLFHFVSLKLFKQHK